ncbi:uncharacterized protein BO88DRAFT_424134 [Aspergillus vadensis CBS 113365]|uniref:Uncharacterized protein n=1 Tax=Aspergillus vadensis (strain CBS 113365 / IMI 142717 / IBT 24658) TaxID=1448311 RepID=A0A319BCT9_ASPVC|nr:hypothetical protein BO88DRAFT_424134 [Aspergillus vadensis CBS 113365]PYH70565.1 hypothetical protein BO88DRAFT_424134 [Aspergillus vadensis CBS 113365]
MHVGRSATVTGHRIICNMHSSAVSPADTSYIEQMNADRAVLLHQRVLPVRSGILLGFFGRDLSQPCLGRGGAPIRRVRIGSAIQAHYSHEVPQCGKAAFDLDSTKSLPDICHVGSRNDGQQWRCVPRNCFPTPVCNRYRIISCLDWHLSPEVRGAIACPVHRFEIFGGPGRTNRPPATPGLQYSTSAIDFCYGVVP